MQKFHSGDLVHVEDDFSFTAIVVDAELHGGCNYAYRLFVLPLIGDVCWYPEYCLTLLEPATRTRLAEAREKKRLLDIRIF